MQYNNKKYGISISIEKMAYDDSQIIEHLIKNVSLKSVSFDTVDTTTYEIKKEEYELSDNSIDYYLGLYKNKKKALFNLYKGKKESPFLSYKIVNSHSSLSISENKTTILDWIDKINSDVIINNSNLKSLSFSPTTNTFSIAKPDDVIYWQLIKSGKKNGFQGVQNELGLSVEWFSVIPSSVEENLRGYYTFRDENNKLLPSAKFIPHNPFPSDDILLKIPAYRVERLPGGGTLVQLTKEINVYEKDAEYIEAWFKAYDYLKSQIVV